MTTKSHGAFKGHGAFEVFAKAKINLTLHVTGQRDDGYHLLHSLVMFGDVGDRIWFEPSAQMRLEVSGPFAAGVPVDARNLVWQAAVLAGKIGHIRLEKNLPHGAGIGGGSSDAGALLRELGCDDDGLSLGADVPVCRLGCAAVMSGIGDRVDGLAGMSPLFAVLANPRVHLPTPQVFAGLEHRVNPPMSLPDAPFGSAADLIAWLAAQRNDLEAAAIACAPQIADVLTALGNLSGQGLARMSGSGATCFALFERADLAAAAAQELQATHPEWWVTDCALS